MKYLRTLAFLLALLLLTLSTASCRYRFNGGQNPAGSSSFWNREPSEHETSTSPIPEIGGDTVELCKYTSKDIAYDEATGINYVNSIVNICFDEHAALAERMNVVDKIGGTVAGVVDFLHAFQVRIPPKDLNSLQALCKQLEEEPCVDIATVEKLLEGEQSFYNYFPNDEKFQSWDPTDSANRNWGLIAISADMAWGYRNLLSPVKVGIMDSGFRMDHPDLEGKIRYIEGSSTYVSSHGTHVAGIIGAKMDNGIGIAGVAPNAELLAYAYPHWEDGSAFFPSFYTCVGVGLAVRAGAKVINVSLGGFSPVISEEAAQASRTMGILIRAGYEFVVVQCAGNSGNTDACWNGLFCAISEKNCHTLFASKEEILGRVIIVASADRKGDWYQVDEQSCGGSQVSICAPGRNIFSCVDSSYSTERPDGYFVDEFYDPSQLDWIDSDGNWYSYMSGTSMATPYVSGVAAMVWGANPELTGKQVKELICKPENAPIVVPDNPETKTKGDYRMVNAYRPLKEALIQAGKIDPDGDISGGTTSTDQDHVIIDVDPDGLDEIRQAERSAFLNFMHRVTEGGEFHNIEPDWMFVDNDVYDSTYLVRFGLADVDFDGHEELIIYHNQYGQYSYLHVFDGSAEYDDVVLRRVYQLPTSSEDAQLKFYLTGTVEFVDLQGHSSHFTGLTTDFWSAYGYLNAPSYYGRGYGGFSWLSVPETYDGDTVDIMIGDDGDWHMRTLTRYAFLSMLKDLRSGNICDVQLYPVRSSYISSVLG